MPYLQFLDERYHSFLIIFVFLRIPLCIWSLDIIIQSYKSVWVLSLSPSTKTNKQNKTYSLTISCRASQKYTMKCFVGRSCFYKNTSFFLQNLNIGSLPKVALVFKLTYYIT